MGKFCRVCLLLGALSCVSLLAGCATAGGAGAGVADSVLDYQRQVAILEARIALYEGAVGNAVEELGDLASRAGGIDGTVDELISLFDEYQRRVDELLRLYREAREESEGAGQGSPGAGDSVWSDDFSEDSGVRVIREGD